MRGIVLTLLLAAAATALPLNAEQSKELMASAETSELLNELIEGDRQVSEPSQEADNSGSDEQLETKRDKLYAGLENIRLRRSLIEKFVKSGFQLHSPTKKGEILHDELRRLRRQPEEDPEPAHSHCGHNQQVEDHPDNLAHEHLGHKSRRAVNPDSSSSSSSSEERKKQQATQEPPVEQEAVAARRRRHAERGEEDSAEQILLLLDENKASEEEAAAPKTDNDEEPFKASIEDYVQGCEVMEVNSKEANETTYLD